jgi:platelet-activating factor acetylhydrolase IB subunit beta/gamma
MKSEFLFAATMLLLPLSAGAIDYPYQTSEPQKTGWPLTPDERSYIVDKPEYDRRPGRDANKHLPQLWPVVPCAGHWGGTSWLDTHAKLVEYVKANPGPCDVLLVGDSITQQWGSPLDKGVLNEAWKKHFADYRTINIGIGGDKTQNVLWRLDHGGVEGLQPKVVIVMIGNNNMFFTPETGIEPAARGVQICLLNLRDKFPKAAIIVAKILPCHAPGNTFYEDIKKTNAALDTLQLDRDPQVRMLDLTSDFTNPDGTLKKELFTPDNIHLSLAGYAVYAERLKPLLDKLHDGKGLGGAVVIPNQASTSEPAAPASKSSTPNPARPVPVQPAAEILKATRKTADGKSLVYPYPPYNEGRMDPQLTGWPLTDDEKAWVTKPEYSRKPGHEVLKHLPEMWFVTPTAARWGNDGEENAWLAHHAKGIEKVRAMRDGLDIALIGDSITQGWGGAWDGAPFNSAWNKHFGDQKTVNLGIGGDRMENILWRLDHGALDGTSPKVIVLMIGVNNAPLVHANGVPASAAAQGIKLCVENLRLRCPQSQIVLVKILPAFDPAKEVGARIREMNEALDGLKLDAEPHIRVLDLWKDFTNADGSLKTELYSDQHLHLGIAGYQTLASKLKLVVEPLLK